MNIKTKSVLISIALSCAPGAALLAAVLHLKDGGQLSGTVVSATAADVQLQTDAGLVKVPADKVRSIDYGDAPLENAAPPPAEAPDERRPRGRRRHAWRRAPEPPPENAADAFTFSFGVASPLSRISADSTGGGAVSNGGTGALFGLRYLHAWDPRLEAGLELDFFGRSATEQGGLVPYARTRVSGGDFTPLAVLKWSPAPRERAVRPYLLAGAGPSRASLTVEARPLFGFVWADTGTDETRRLVDGARWGWAAKAAAGLDFQSWGDAVGGLEVGWTEIKNAAFEGTAAGRNVGLNGATGRLSALTVAGHWGWRF